MLVSWLVIDDFVCCGSRAWRCLLTQGRCQARRDVHAVSMQKPTTRTSSISFHVLGRPGPVAPCDFQFFPVLFLFASAESVTLRVKLKTVYQQIQLMTNFLVRIGCAFGCQCFYRSREEGSLVSQ